MNTDSRAGASYIVVSCRAALRCAALCCAVRVCLQRELTHHQLCQFLLEALAHFLSLLLSCLLDLGVGSPDHVNCVSFCHFHVW